MAVTWVWVGAVGPDSAWVRGKITGSSARLAVDTNPAFPDPVFYGPATPTGDGVVSIRAAGLASDTRYHYALEVDDTLDTANPGRFRSHPDVGSQATFTLAAFSCAGGPASVPGDGDELSPNQVSNHPAFDDVREQDPLLLLHMGDLHYYDLGTGRHGIGGGASVTNYRRAYDDVLDQPRQHQLYREVPTAYTWDDHDFGGNNSGGGHPGKAAATQVYRERVPHYPLPDSGGAIYHSFEVGRVLIICSDTRFHRSPNSDPDGPDKTMLGGAQKAWMDSLLASSDAELLIWHMPSQWMGTSVDSWDRFRHERDELVAMFRGHGWLDRMCIVSGDIHALAIDTGAGNRWGGFPVFQFASIDSSDAGQSTGQYDRGGSQGRQRYGTIRIEDGGTEIRVTGTGWIGDSVWQSHAFTVSPDGDGNGGPSPGVPPVSEAAIRTRVTWLGCDLVTGRIIAELPDIGGRVSRVLGSHTSAGVRMPIPLAGPAALGKRAIQATQPGRTMIIAVVNDAPTWGGVVLTRKGGTDATLDLATVSIEGYLDRRYVRDHTWQQADEASVIAAGLVGDAQNEGIGLVVDAPPTGTLRDRTYQNSDDATVYRRLEELMAVENGPEWTIDLDWMDSSQTTVAKVFRVRKRIGVAATQPNAVFETTAHSVFSSRGASQARYTYSEDFSAGSGANHVLATTSGEGEDRPTSSPARAEDFLAAGWPRYESRISPSTSIKNVSVLDEHARAELALTKFGSRTWEITARWDAIPRYGVDWRLGDDVAWRLTGHRHPDGVTGQGRVIGFNLDMQAGTVQPILWEPE